MTVKGSTGTGRFGNEETALTRAIPQDNVGSVCLRIAATFTAEPLEDPLAYWLRKLGFDLDIAFAPYGQLFQELLNPNSLLARNTRGINVLLIRVEDWFRFEAGGLSEEKLQSAVIEFDAALTGFASNGPKRLLLGLCPHTIAGASRLSAALDAAETCLMECASRLSSVEVLDLRALGESYVIERLLDEMHDRLGHVPFAAEFFTAMGTELARRVFSTLHPPSKVVVVDCDNTLWNGVCGEDGPHGVAVTPTLIEFQEFLVQQQANGKLLCLCSKNYEADPWSVVDQNVGMRLRREHIVTARINWIRKSENLLSLARELNLGLDSFVFVDDDPAECDEVASALPGVLCICVPAEPRAVLRYFRHHWAFDEIPGTAEDHMRTEFYRQNGARQALRTRAISYQEYIQELKVETEIRSLQPVDLPRAAQLTQRTNQFNATLIRRTAADLEALAAEPRTRVLTTRVRDRFGDYGLVGILVARAEGKALACETFLLSCRVLGKRVEHAMIRQLTALAADWQLAELQLRYRSSDRNRPVAEFFEGLGWRLELRDRGEQRFCLALTEVEAALAAAKIEQGAEEEIISGASAPPGGGAPVLRDFAQVLDEIARMGGDATAMMQRMNADALVRQANATMEFVEPRTVWEKSLALIWSDVLRVDRIGLHDSFVDIGGYSIKAIKVIFQIRERFGVELSLQTILDQSQTIERLARQLETAAWMLQEPGQALSSERVTGEI